MTAFEKTFDSAALDYDKSRPAYIKEIYEDILHYKPINSDSNILEIGVGTGKASQPILNTQCHFIGIEPGEQLADLARNRYKAYKNFSLFNQTFQDFASTDKSFDLIYAATAFHWLPEAYGYNRVFNLLKPGGAFARFAYHAGHDQGRIALTDEIQKLYQKYMRSENQPAEFSNSDAQKLAEKALAYGFVDIKHMLYHTTKDFTADEYITLLRTYPDHMKIEAADRKKLFEGIHSAVNNYGGIMTVYYTMDLELARKP